MSYSYFFYQVDFIFQKKIFFREINRFEAGPKVKIIKRTTPRKADFKWSQFL